MVRQMKCQRSHIVHCVDTMFCFTSSVCFGSFKSLILSDFATDWCFLLVSASLMTLSRYFLCLIAVISGSANLISTSS